MEKEINRTFSNAEDLNIDSLFYQELIGNMDKMGIEMLLGIANTMIREDKSNLEEVENEVMNFARNWKKED